jgi:cellulose synthase/poly-beta-1,6-N-acetylglucosamine synthase-like glycosyltransferase
VIAAVVVTAIVAFLAYTYAGYPIAIGALARLFPRARAAAGPVGEAGDDPAASVPAPAPLVSVCLAVYNGADYLPAKIESLLAQDHPADRIEILIYCDGCRDDSEAVARGLAAAPEAAGRIRVFASSERRGKPASLNAMAPEATGDLLLLTDVRQPFSKGATRALVEAMRDPAVACATGNLVLQGGAGSGVYWRYENWIRQQESRFRGVVGMSGAIAMMRRADWQALPDDLILDDVWIPMRLGLGGRRVVFVAAAEAYDTAFDDDQEFRRKVRTLAGNYQLFARLPVLLLPIRNPFWFETVSHKVARLCAPWLMLALVSASSGAAVGGPPAARPWLAALLAVQLGFYGLAVAGGRAGRIGRIARTFVVMNVAAMVGLWRFLARRQRVTW